ncbi:hypothetical protein FACS1894176_05770 [Bacteroidia bacterium]|nr:hypothetical protein FACS189428_2700 [Clostridia bacterium]GHV25974.1 hypothetical protein FACS1894176_05770 [Bacteroidia bacterium]
MITIDGSLLTNVQEGNTTTTNIKNSSILGGNKNNFPVAVTGSTIIGGSENKVQANQSTILGGIKNQIQNTTSYRSTILGGSENTLKGAESTII